MSRFNLIPSPFDRLDPLARVIRWWTTQIGDVVGRPSAKTVSIEDLQQRKKRVPRLASIVLGETDAFAARLRLPKGNATAHENAIKLRLHDLAPVDPAHLQIAATAVEQNEAGAVTYAVAMARQSRLADLEAQARRKGARSVLFHAEGLPEIELRSAKTQQAERRSLLVDGGIVAAALVAAVAAVTVWTGRIEAGTLALADQERTIRRAAIASEAARRDAELARDFIDRGVLDRRAGAVLDTLAALNAATPDGAWWTLVRWTPDEVTISAQARDAATAIEAISRSAGAWTVELNGAINAGDPQTFDLRLRPRKAAAP